MNSIIITLSSSTTTIIKGLEAAHTGCIIMDHNGMTLNTDIDSFKDIYLFIFLFWPYRGGISDLSTPTRD